ncbi:MAG: hypothetical protein R3E68_08800 [Burkholderiaceae bacterium]
MGHEHDGLARLLPDTQQLEFIFSRVSASRAPNGSSINTSLGSWISARAMAALLHAAGQFVRILVLGARLEPHQGQQLARPPACLRHRQAEQLGRQQDVVEDAPPLEQQRLLKDHADVPSRVERMGGRAERHRAFILLVQAGQDLEQRGLAATRWPDHRDQFAGHDLERGIRKWPGVPCGPCGRSC